MKAQRTLGAGVLVVSVLAQPAWLVAAADAHGAHHDPSLSDLVFPLINFTIFAVIVAKYVVPAAREYLRRRREDVVAALDESSAALADAERALTRTHERQAGLVDECQRTRRDLVAGATRLAERLRAQAEASGKRRLADAALVAEQERRRAVESVRVEIASLAATVAETRVRQALTPEDQRSFVRKFLQDVPTR